MEDSIINEIVNRVMRRLKETTGKPGAAIQVSRLDINDLENKVDAIKQRASNTELQLSALQPDVSLLGDRVTELESLNAAK